VTIASILSIVDDNFLQGIKPEEQENRFPGGKRDPPPIKMLTTSY
jgi:hypothetical protein